MPTSYADMSHLLSKRPLGQWAKKDLTQKSEILKALYDHIEELNVEEKRLLENYLALCLGKESSEVKALFDSILVAAPTPEAFEDFIAFFQSLKPLDAKMMLYEKPDGQNPILLREHLNSSIKPQLSPEIWGLLPPKVQKHLEQNNITLYQLMTHYGGLGDYGYDIGSGTYRENLEAGNVTQVSEIKDFLNFAEDTIYSTIDKHYSNLGITLAGLAVEYAYQSYQQKHLFPMAPLNFFGLLKQFVLDRAHMTNFFEKAPLDDEHTVKKTNPRDKAALAWVGGPAGGYWTTTEDLVKFGQWLYGQCQDPTFRELIEEYGKEFCEDGKMIMHPGSTPYSTAFFFLDLITGKTGAVVSTEGCALPLGLEVALSEHFFTNNPPLNDKPFDELTENPISDLDNNESLQEEENSSNLKYSQLGSST